MEGGLLWSHPSENSLKEQIQGPMDMLPPWPCAGNEFRRSFDPHQPRFNAVMPIQVSNAIRIAMLFPGKTLLPATCVCCIRVLNFLFRCVSAA